VLVTADRSEQKIAGLQISDHFLHTIYIIGVIVCIIKLIIDFSSVVWMILSKGNGCRIIKFNGFGTAGFSALGFIFINTQLTSEEAGNVIKHESNHLKQNHYIDIILMEFIAAFQWFNPVMHLMNRELRAIHEYQADQGCLDAGIPVVNYQKLIFNQIFRSKAFELTNSFTNPSLIRKRMLMMTKKRSSELSSFKVLSVIPVTALLLFSISAKPNQEIILNNNANIVTTIQDIPEDPNEVPYTIAEEMPVFPGGDAAILRYIDEHIDYPENARRNNIQGRVIVRFCVTKTGSISRVSVLKNIDPELDAEAVRVVKTLPPFTPGRQKGVPVSVWYLLPITFSPE
jgi:TonB family protein